MNPPWEIMMNFQKSLKPGAAGSDGKKTTQVQLSAAAQRFLPSSSIASSRIQKVRNIINESTRIIEESRLPELNNTTLNFCQNCTCDSCSNASILNGTQLNNPNIHILYQAFENFIKVQKQQFMAMIQQVASFDDTASTDFFTSCTPCNQPAVTECDSSESAKSMGAVSSSRESTQRNGATSTSSSRTLDTVDEGELSDCTAISENELKEIEINVGECIKDETSPTAVTSDTKGEKVKGSLISQDDLEVDLDGNSDFDFDNYVDDSFKPVRRSSILKMRESFVVLEKLETANQRQCDIKPSIPSKTGSIGKTVLVDKSNFTAPSNCENKMKAYAPPVEVSCTRSGRVLRKPQPYWTKGSRVGIKEEISDNNKDEPVLPRRGGHNVSHKIKPKQNVPKTRKHHIVSSSSDALAPSKTGVKRERKKKSTSHPDSTHATRDASKNMLAKKRKIESQTAEPSLMDSEYEQIPGAVAKSQSIRSKRSTRRGIQTENTDVALSNVKETTQREKAKNRILKPKKVDLRKRTGKGADNAVFQLKQGVRYPSLSGELSSETEPEYECYLNGNISD